MSSLLSYKLDIFYYLSINPLTYIIGNGLKLCLSLLYSNQLKLKPMKQTLIDLHEEALDYLNKSIGHDNQVKEYEAIVKQCEGLFNRKRNERIYWQEQSEEHATMAKQYMTMYNTVMNTLNSGK